MLRAFEKLLAPVKRQIRLLLSYGVVRLVNASYKAQGLQVTGFAGEVLNARHWEPYGYTSHPLPGAEALLGSLGGDRAFTDAIVVADRRYRLTNLESGEVAIYDDLGNVIHFKRDRILINGVDMTEIIAPICHIVATTTHDGDFTINGNLVVNGITTTNGLAVTGTAGATTMTGNVTVTGGDVTVDGISAKGHIHGGVQTGGGTTGAPQ